MGIKKFIQQLLNVPAPEKKVIVDKRGHSIVIDDYRAIDLPGKDCEKCQKNYKK